MTDAFCKTADAFKSLYQVPSTFHWNGLVYKLYPDGLLIEMFFRFSKPFYLPFFSNRSCLTATFFFFLGSHFFCMHKMQGNFPISPSIHILCTSINFNDQSLKDIRSIYQWHGHEEKNQYFLEIFASSCYVSRNFSWLIAFCIISLFFFFFFVVAT